MYKFTSIIIQLVVIIIVGCNSNKALFDSVNVNNDNSVLSVQDSDNLNGNTNSASKKDPSAIIHSRNRKIVKCKEYNVLDEMDFEAYPHGYYIVDTEGNRHLLTDNNRIVNCTFISPEIVLVDSLKNVDFSGCHFIKAYIDSTLFEKCNFTNCVFEGGNVNIKGSDNNFTNTLFKPIDYSAPHPCVAHYGILGAWNWFDELHQNDAVLVCISGNDLQQTANFKKRNFIGVQLGGSFENIDFSECVFTFILKGNLTNCKFHDTVFIINKYVDNYNYNYAAYSYQMTPEQLKQTWNYKTGAFDLMFGNCKDRVPEAFRDIINKRLSELSNLRLTNKLSSCKDYTMPEDGALMLPRNSFKRKRLGDPMLPNDAVVLEDSVDASKRVFIGDSAYIALNFSTLKNVDFSESQFIRGNIDFTNFDNCDFSNCVFEGGSIKVYGANNKFTNVIFKPFELYSIHKRGTSEQKDAKSFLVPLKAWKNGNPFTEFVFRCDLSISGNDFQQTFNYQKKNLLGIALHDGDYTGVDFSNFIFSEFGIKEIQNCKFNDAVFILHSGVYDEKFQQAFEDYSSLTVEQFKQTWNYKTGMFELMFGDNIPEKFQNVINSRKKELCIE